MKTSVRAGFLVALLAPLVCVDCNCGKGGMGLQGIDPTPEAADLDFGSVPVGQTKTLPLQLTNSGNAPLQISNLTLGGANPGAFQALTSFQSAIAPGNSATANIQFAPTAVGSFAATLAIASNSQGIPVLTIHLTGTAFGSALVATPQPLDFGAVPVGQSATLTLTLQNQGSAAISGLQALAATGPQASAFTAQQPSGTLAAGASETVSVTFSPTQAGAASASLPIGCPDCAPLTVTLQGQGANGALSFAPSPILFQNVPVGLTLSQNVSVTNIGEVPVAVGAVSLQGGGSSPFVLSGLPALPLALGAGTSFTLQISYTPTQAQDAGVGDSLSVAYTLPGGGAPSTGPALDPVTASASGSPCQLTLSPTSLSFGAVQALQTYAQTSTLSNAGQSDCILSNIALDPSSDQGYSVPAAMLLVPAGASVPLEVDFEIPFAGQPTTRQGLLTFQSNDPNLTQGSLPLTADLSVTGAYDAGWPTCATSSPVFPPKSPLLPPTVPADCRTGFEMNSQATMPWTFSLQSLAPQGSRPDLTLELDLATYAAPDSLLITATDDGGVSTAVFGSCDVQTSSYPDPTDDHHRPTEDSVRDFRVPIPAGTTQLSFAFDQGMQLATPYYVRVDGLCDFDTSTIQTLPSEQDYRPFDDRDCLAGSCEDMSLCGAIVQHCGQSYDCSAAANCNGGPLSSFQDPLSSLDAAWTTFGDAGTAVGTAGDAGQLGITLPGSVLGVAAGLATVQHYDMSLASYGCASVNLANAGAVADPDAGVEAWLALKDTDSNELKVAVGNGMLTANLVDGDGQISLSPSSIPFAPTASTDLTICWNGQTLGFGSTASGIWASVAAPGTGTGMDPEMGCTKECGSAVAWLPVVQVELGAQRLVAGSDVTVLFDGLTQ